MNRDSEAQIPLKKAIWLRHYAALGLLRRACDAANAEIAASTDPALAFAAAIYPKTVRSWREQDEEFHEACRDAEREAVESLEAEMIRRGKEGWDEPVFSKS